MGRNHYSVKVKAFVVYYNDISRCSETEKDANILSVASGISLKEPIVRLP